MKKITKIIGKPGTGKTTYLASMIIEKIKSGATPNDIFFTSFSRSASRAIFEKFEDEEFDIFPKDHFRTVYSKSNKVLGFTDKNYTTIGDYIYFCDSKGIEYDPPKSLKRIEDVDEFGVGNESTGQLVEGNILFDWWQLLKCKYINNVAVKRMIYSYADLPEKQREHIQDRDREQIQTFFDLWEEYKRRKCRYEYVDLLQIVMERRLPFVHPFRYAFIDEAHDLGALQMGVIQQWCGIPERDVDEFICFDEMQTIYKFVGADPLIVKNIQATEPDIILRKSYRVPKIPWEFAKRIASTLHDTTMDQIEPSDREGDMIFDDKIPILDGREKSFILARRNTDVHDIVNQFYDSRIPIKGLGRTKTIWNAGKYSIFQDIHNLLIKLQAEQIPTRDEIKSLFIKIPAKYLIRGVKTDFKTGTFKMWDGGGQKKLVDDDLSVFYNFFQGDIGNVNDVKEIISMPNIHINQLKKDYLLKITEKDKIIDKVIAYTGTYHSSKGLEAKNVVLMDYYLREGWNVNDETKLAYVGATRTLDNLYIIEKESGDDFVSGFY